LTNGASDSGTHRGPFWGIAATDRRIEIQEISIFRVANGRIAEQWCLVDELGRLQQLAVGVEHLRQALRL
jgi:predicted ester cyclase